MILPISSLALAMQAELKPILLLVQIVTINVRLVRSLMACKADQALLLQVRVIQLRILARNRSPTSLHSHNFKVKDHLSRL